MVVLIVHSVKTCSYTMLQVKVSPFSLTPWTLQALHWYNTYLDMCWIAYTGERYIQQSVGEDWFWKVDANAFEGLAL